MSYFDDSVQEIKTRGEGQARYVLGQDLKVLEAAPGVRIQPILGHGINVNWVYMDAHAVATVHQHVEEQIGTIVSGRVRFELEGEIRILNPGDSYVIPSYAKHGATALDGPVVIIDSFTPVREGLLALFTDQTSQ